ncbi:endonuclease III [Coprothermobacteraceae bacterium]|nr:endonuclease III [Coprothermobacteraceae bacterium]
MEALADKHKDALRFDLNFENAYQLLIAAMLAAQASDESVNQVTPSFFSRFPNPREVVAASIEDLEKAIYPVNFYKTKAKRVREACQVLVDRFNGEVPDDVEALSQLPGVGKKTANMVLLGAYGKPAVVVDRHVLRVLDRLGFHFKDADQAEQELKSMLPESHWGLLSYALMRHGKRLCLARKPNCLECPVKGICPSREEA